MKTELLETASQTREFENAGFLCSCGQKNFEVHSEISVNHKGPKTRENKTITVNLGKRNEHYKETH